MTTPNAVQNYTRLMAPVFSDLDMIPVFTFFQHLFSGPMSQTIIEPDSEVIDIDIQRGNKKLAVYIPRGSDAINLGPDLDRALVEKYTSDSKVLPQIVTGKQAR